MMITLRVLNTKIIPDIDDHGIYRLPSIFNYFNKSLLVTYYLKARIFQITICIRLLYEFILNGQSTVIRNQVARINIIWSEFILNG